MDTAPPSQPPVTSCRDSPCGAAVHGLPLSFLCLSLRRANDLTGGFGSTERKAPHVFLSHWERVNSMDGCWSAQAQNPHPRAQKQVSIIFLNCCKSKSRLNQDTASHLVELDKREMKALGSCCKGKCYSLLEYSILNFHHLTHTWK